jgi:hypothetical protein
VLAREQAFDLRQVQHARKELGPDIAIEQPIPVLARFAHASSLATESLWSDSGLKTI